jgi:hypothetical protein
VNQPVEGVDARTDRVAQAVVGVAVLSAFVFRLPWIVPVLAVVLGIGALAGPHANVLQIVIQRWITPRLPAPKTEAAVPVTTVRAQDALAAAILLVAGSAFILGVGFVGWLLVIVEAVVAIIAATTGIHLAELLQRRLQKPD